MKLHRPSPSLVVSAVALSLALGGGVGYAAGSLPKNSVTSKQIKNGAVKAADLKKDAVTSAAVKDGSLTGADLSAGSITGAQVDESTLRVPAAGGKVVLAGQDFRPVTDTTSYFGSGGEIVPTEAGVHTFSVRVRVPVGTRPTSVTWYVRDDSGSFDASLLTFVVTPSTGANTPGPATTTSGDSSSVLTLTSAAPAVPDGAYLDLRPGLLPEITLLGAEVAYAPL